MFDQPPERIDFHPEQQLTVETTLPAGLWRDALRLIQDWPWRVANPIIGQWMSQLQRLRDPPEPPPPEPEPEPPPEPEPVQIMVGDADPA